MKANISSDTALQEALDSAFEHWEDNHLSGFLRKSYHVRDIFQSMKASIKHYFKKRMEVAPAKTTPIEEPPNDPLTFMGIPLPSATIAPPPRKRIIFGTGEGSNPVVGILYLDDGSFEGDPHESAKLFWESLTIDGKNLFEKIKALEEEIDRLNQKRIAK